MCTASDGIANIVADEGTIFYQSLFETGQSEGSLCMLLLGYHQPPQERPSGKINVKSQSGPIIFRHFLAACVSHLIKDRLTSERKSETSLCRQF